MKVPFASPLDFIDAFHPSGDGGSLWFIFSGEQLLMANEGRDLPQKPSIALKRELYMGTLAGQHLFAAEAQELEIDPKRGMWKNLRGLHGFLNDEYYAVAGRAMQLLGWDRVHRYCGCCGTETFVRKTERCRECPSCGYLAYPKLAPAVIVLIKKEDKILLSRSPHFPEKFYSVIAGYVDPGETLEQCIHREVFEEVGLKVKNVRYFASQPWPFSHSLMIGFICDWERGEISIDPQELADAAWFDHTHLPQLPPPLSISRMLIDAYLANELTEKVM